MDITLNPDMVRPTKYNLLDPDEVRKVASNLGSFEEIASLLGVSPKTLLKAREERPEIAMAIDEARARVGAAVANRLVESALDGSVEAAKFLLERRFQWIKLTQNQVELSGKPNMPTISITLQGPGSELLNEKVIN